MKPSPELINEWCVKAKVARLNDPQPGVYEYTLAELAAAWGAKQAQQTTDPLGFQIRRAIAAEDELRATKQTLEHAYAALQKVADAQAAIEEPALPEAEVHVRHGFDRNGSHSMGEYMCECGAHGDQPCKSDLYTATQMHDHYAAGVRAGMVQSQDAKRWQFIDACQDLTPFLREYHSGVCLSIEEINKAMKGGQK